MPTWPMYWFLEIIARRPFHTPYFIGTGKYQKIEFPNAQHTSSFPTWFTIHIRIASFWWHGFLRDGKTRNKPMVSCVLIIYLVSERFVKEEYFCLHLKYLPYWKVFVWTSELRNTVGLDSTPKRYLMFQLQQWGLHVFLFNFHCLWVPISTFSYQISQDIYSLKVPLRVLLLFSLLCLFITTQKLVWSNLVGHTT